MADISEGQIRESIADEGWRGRGVGSGESEEKTRTCGEVIVLGGVRSDRTDMWQQALVGRDQGRSRGTEMERKKEIDNMLMAMIEAKQEENGQHSGSDSSDDSSQWKCQNQPNTVFAL
ncbi:hypothetical protein Bbelb_295170 [Branchiostoma belcheri]|nr:hypothetical protein Bbelb_295170 [Branchiostoma belcheri]